MNGNKWGGKPGGLDALNGRSLNVNASCVRGRTRPIRKTMFSVEALISCAGFTRQLASLADTSLATLPIDFTPAAMNESRLADLGRTDLGGLLHLFRSLTQKVSQDFQKRATKFL